MTEENNLQRKLETLRLLYRNKGVTDLSDDELRFLVHQQDERVAIWGGVIRILAVVAILIWLVLRFR